MRHPILELISSQILIADGAIGTELQRLGLDSGICGEVWNLDQPEKVLGVHCAYVAAGAQLITTNSFRGNRAAMEHFDLAPRVVEINRAAASIAREAAGESAWVMGSIGPFGGFIEPLGETSVAEAYDIFTQQARALVEGGVDALVIETMTAVDEIGIAIRAARDAGAPVVIATMAFDRVKDSFKTMMGVGIDEAVEVMSGAGADVVGCNCGTGLTLADYAEIVRQMRACTDRPIIVQPNAGQPELVSGEVVYQHAETPAAAEMFAEAGANIIGGCCGTTPDYTRIVASSLSLRAATRQPTLRASRE